MSETNKIIKKISKIKTTINQIFRDKPFKKDFSQKIIELLYEIDDYTEFISIEIILKTDLHKTLKILFQLSDVYLDIKKLCHSILEDILKNIENELFNYEQDIFFDYVNDSSDKIEFNKNLFIQDLGKLIEKRNYQNDNDNDNIIKTDQKFLEKIKKDEMLMNNEYRRREKVKKIENEKRFNLFISNNNNNKNNLSNFNEDKILKRKKRNINVEVINNKNHINILIEKSALNGIKHLFEHNKDNHIKNTHFLGKKKYKRLKKKIIKKEKKAEIIIEIPSYDNSEIYFNHFKENINIINQDNKILLCNNGFKHDK